MAMLNAMLEALDDQDIAKTPYIHIDKASPIVKKPKGWSIAEQQRIPEQASLPLCYFADYDTFNVEIPEHRLIMTPDFTNLEGIYAITEHLGEHKAVKHFTVKGEKGQHANGSGLTNLEKIIYYEAGMTGQGDAVLPHEDHSQRAWYKVAGKIKSKFNCTIEQAETLKMAFDILDTTPKMAVEFDKWLKTEGKFEAGFKWFENIASQLVLCTDEGEPTIITDSYIEDEEPVEVSADNPADIANVTAEAYHKLDDNRDQLFDEEKNETAWEKKQPAAFKKIIKSIKAATLPELKTIGKSLFNDKTFTKTQTTVIWDTYKRRKHALTPKLRPLALKALERLIDPEVNLGKVANWLHSDGKTALNAHEQSVVWNAWKQCKARKTANVAKAEPMPEQIPIWLDYEGMEEGEWQ
jgi:hypothetical protein